MPRKTTAPQVERERLKEELRTLARSRAVAEREAAAADKAAKQIEASYRTALEEAARGDEGAKADADAARIAVAEKHAEASHAREQAQAATRGRSRTEKELRQHLSDNLPTFVAEAKAASDEAVAARQAVLDAIRDARTADAAARQAWKPLMAAVRSVAEDGRTFGGRSGRDLGPLPPVPTLLEGELAADLEKAPPPSPANLRDARQAAAAIRNGAMPTALRRLIRAA